MNLNRLTDFYKRFELYISPIGLIYGFIFTMLTSTRADLFWDNFWVVVNLLLASFAILAVVVFENRADKRKASEEEKEKFNFYLTLIIQFAFGGLFSTFFVFYFISSSLSDSWFFLLILLILLIGNELWKKHYSRLAFQISILFISIYLFFSFLLPVLFHRLGADLFILSGILSLITIFLFGLGLRKFAKEKFRSHYSVIKISLASIFVLMNLLYFTNIIPPIPLALKNSGVYHKIIKVSPGVYEAQGEQVFWRDYFKKYPIFHHKLGESIYAFSAIFSPVQFDTEIIHLWQYYDDINNKWIDSSRITLPITGGREDGYRTYSLKRVDISGLWRVKVMIRSGQVLGKINFTVEDTIKLPDLIIKNL